MDGSRHSLQQRKEGRPGIGNKAGSSLATSIVFLSNSVAQALLASFQLPVACRDQLLLSQYNTLHLLGYKLDWNVYTCLKQLYDGRNMYIIYYLKNSCMFRHFSFINLKMANEKC